MEFKLSAENRAKKEKLSHDIMAGVLYGRGLEARSIKLNYNAFVKIFNEAGESNIITLSLDGKDYPVLVKSTQKDVLKSNYIHVDFYQVNMKEKVKAEIPLEFVGESKAVKEMSGVFLANIDELSVECLPADLVDHIDVDISGLVAYGDMIRLKDLNLPLGMEIMHHEANEVVCVVDEPKKVEAEPEATIAAGAASSSAAAAAADASTDPKAADKK